MIGPFASNAQRSLAIDDVKQQQLGSPFLGEP
jgi:hypothetical protein